MHQIGIRTTRRKVSSVQRRVQPRRPILPLAKRLCSRTSVAVSVAGLLCAGCAGGSKPPLAASPPSPSSTTPGTKAPATTPPPAPMATLQIPLPTPSHHLEPAPTPARPALTASPTTGSPGTLVILSARHCAPLSGQSERGFFADSAARSHPDDPRLRHSLKLHVGSDHTITATYRIRADDSIGLGYFEILCGGPGNAVATYTVTRR